LSWILNIWTLSWILDIPDLLWIVDIAGLSRIIDIHGLSSMVAMLQRGRRVRLNTVQDLGNAVRALRRRKGLTQQELARRAGLSRQWLAGLENGTANPSWEVVLRLAAALDADVALNDRGAPPNQSERRPGVDLDALLAAHRGA
jgi:HTH-type transcriptional regulator/antitoxin HipB